MKVACHQCKETPDEEAFWSDQICGQRVGFCDGFVDRKWQAQANRRTRAKEVMERMREKSEQGKRKRAGLKVEKSSSVFILKNATPGC